LAYATGWTVRGSNPGGGWRDLPHPSIPALGHTQPPLQCVPGLSRGLSGRGVALTTHSHLATTLREEYSYTSTPSLGLRGLLQGDLYLYLYAYIYATRRFPQFVIKGMKCYYGVDKRSCQFLTLIIRSKCYPAVCNIRNIFRSSYSIGIQ